MNLQSNSIGKGLLVFYYISVLILTIVEQKEYFNEFFIAIPLCLVGLFFTIRLTFKDSLFFTLLVFPLAFDQLYFQILAPHLPLYLIHLNMNTWLFGSFYLLFLGIIYFKNWVFIGLFTFLIGLIILEKQMPYQLLHAFQFDFKGKTSPSLLLNQLARINKNESQPIYLICLDGYPNLDGSEYAKFSRLHSMVTYEKFQKIELYSMSIQTPVSIRHLFTSKYKRQQFTNFNTAAYEADLTNSLTKVSPQNYTVYLGSVLVNYNLAKPFFPVFESIRPNRMILKPFKKYFHEKNRIGSTLFFQKYHERLISEIDGKLHQTKFLHFITFHGLFSQKRILKEEIIFADNLLKRVLKQIREKAPHSKVVIFSDHGERATPGLDPQKAIFYTNF